jgi:hypothetical protein|tara:strand:- start:30081 stop:30890 length:810 start_codon:yes stop_codon:yes gene_type:complete
MSFKHMMFKKQIVRQLFWGLFALSVLTFSLGISWQVSKVNNFFYSFWYQTLDIHQIIGKSVPRNTQGKGDFPINDIELHEKKFADIVDAIHQHGVGLAEITYVNKQLNSRKLLTISEVQHLQDVANLLDNISHYWWGNLFFLLSLAIFYCWQVKNHAGSPVQQLRIASFREMPTSKQKVITVLALMLSVVVLLASLGFTQIFYYLHTVVFPLDHQWFFYYKESLMATLMKAPDIFAAIALQLLLVALVIAVSIDAVISRYQRKNKAKLA